MPETLRSLKMDWRRKVAVVALVAVMGATVSGQTPTAGHLPQPLSRALVSGASLAERARSWSASATHAVTFGILYGTVLSKMNPDVRQSIVAAVEGLREISTVAPAKPLVVKCSVARCPRKKPACRA